jgi:transcriptional regulator with XRE-family HTH domain
MNRIRQLRKKKGLTQVMLASLLHVSQGTISAYESGLIQIDTGILADLSDLFGVSTDYILGRGDDVPAQANAPAAPEPAPGSSAAGWNVEYPAGTALRTQPQPAAPAPSLSDADIARIAERVAQMNRDAKTSPILTMPEQQLIEEYRLLNQAQKIRVQRLIGSFLDRKYNED